jgi:sugar phosphate isomerase/epimerase
MARLGISELTTFRWSFEEDLEHYAAVGVGAVGVWRQKLSDFGEEKGAELLADSGLAVSSLQWAGGFTGSDGRSHAESLQDARLAVRLAAELQAECLIVHSGSRGVHTHNHSRRLFRQAIDKLLPLAEEVGVPLALEPMNGDCGHEWTFLSCLEEARTFVESYHSDHLRIALDTYYWAHDPRLKDHLAELAPRLALVQLGDARQPPGGEPDRCPLGEGSLPLREIISRLDAAGYRGFYEVELMGAEIEASDYREVLAQALRTFDEWTATATS